MGFSPLFTSHSTSHLPFSYECPCLLSISHPFSLAPIYALPSPPLSPSSSLLPSSRASVLFLFLFILTLLLLCPPVFPSHSPSLMSSLLASLPFPLMWPVIVLFHYILVWVLSTTRLVSLDEAVASITACGFPCGFPLFNLT